MGTPRLVVLAATLSLAAIPFDPPAAQEPTPEERAQDEREQRLKKRARLLPHYEYLEDSYVNYSAPNVGPAGDAPLAFEAQAATHLFAKNNWDVVEKPSNVGKMANVVSIDASFVLHLRMVQDHSAPVRPPSYQPGLHVQWFGLWKQRDAPRVHELEAELGFTHHSNGQQGCTFARNVAQHENVRDEDCLKAPEPGTSLRHQLNFRSGDFSTSYAQIGMHYAFMTLDLPDRYLRTRTSIGAVYLPQFVDHHGNWVPGAISREQARLYGIHRLRLELQVRLHLGTEEGFLPGVGSFSFCHEQIWRTRLGVPGFRSVAEASFVLDQYHGVGLFVRGTVGQDDLNVLYLAGRVEMLQFGLVWNTAQAVRYRFGEGRDLRD